MNLEDQIKEALVGELRRQAEEGGLAFEAGADGERVRLSGQVDLPSLAMAVAGAVAGGP